MIGAVFAGSELPITLFSTVLVMCCLLLYKSLLMIKVYKNRFLNVMESIIFFNIAIFALITILSYNISIYSNRESEESTVGTIQEIAAYLSVLILLTFLLIVIVYHSYLYCGCTKVKARLSQSIKKVRSGNQLHEENEIILERSDTNLILDVLDSPRAKYATPFVPFKEDKS